MIDPLICPGCNRKKSKRARLCAECRRRANSVGEQVWTETHVPPPPARPRTADQSQRYGGKCYAIAKREVLDQRDRDAVNGQTLVVRKRAVAWASERFGRRLKSSTDLSEIEMEVVLEHLDEVLEQLDRVTP